MILSIRLVPPELTPVAVPSPLFVTSVVTQRKKTDERLSHAEGKARSVNAPAQSTLLDCKAPPVTGIQSVPILYSNLKFLGPEAEDFCAEDTFILE